MTDDEFERLATLYGFAPSRPLRELLEAAVKAEREACAKVCEQMPDLEHGWRANLPSDCAAAIRARTNT
jgi:hypothetical protein